MHLQKTISKKFKSFVLLKISVSNFVTSLVLLVVPNGRQPQKKQQVNTVKFNTVKNIYNI